MVRPALLAPFLILALSGCWQTDTPLMPAATLDSAPLVGGWTSKGTTAETTRRYRAVAEGKVFKLEKLVQQEPIPVWVPADQLALDALGPDDFIAQATNADGEHFYILLRLSNDNDTLTVLTPACTTEVETAFAAAKDGNVCKFASYAKIRAAAQQFLAALRAGTGDAAIYEQTVYTRD